jgi:hypothetical protein
MLRQIERQFQTERGLARPLRMPSDPREASRNAKRASLGFFVGLVALLISFASSWVVGLIGFVAMLVSAVALVQSLRRLAQVRWGQPATPPEEAGASRGQQRGRQPWSRPDRPEGGKWWTGWGGTTGRGDEDEPH